MQPSGNLLSNPMVPPAQDPSGAIAQTGQAIKNYICEFRREIYAASALAVLSTGGGAAVPAGLTALGTWYVCGDPPPGGGDLPGVSGLGGQCVAPYTITARVRVETLGNNGVVTGTGRLTATWDTIGPIGRVIVNHRNNSGFSTNFAYLSNRYPDGTAPPTAQMSNSSTINLLPATWRIVGEPQWTCVRRDSLPDNCGNPPVIYPPLPPTPPVFPIRQTFITINNSFANNFYMPITIGPITIPVKIGPFALNIGIDNLSIPIDMNGNFYLSGTGATGTSTEQEEKQEEEPNPQPGGGGSTTIRLQSFDCAGEELLDTTRTGELPALLAPVIQDLNLHNQARFEAECEGGELSPVAPFTVKSFNSTAEQQIFETNNLVEEAVSVAVQLNDARDGIDPYKIGPGGVKQARYGQGSWGHQVLGEWCWTPAENQYYENGTYIIPDGLYRPVRFRYAAPIGVSGRIIDTGLRKAP